MSYFFVINCLILKFIIISDKAELLSNHLVSLIQLQQLPEVLLSSPWINIEPMIISS